MIAGILLGIVAGLLANEVCDFSPWCARKLVRWSAFRRYVDPGRAEARAEELTALINDRPGNLFKLFTAVSFAIAAVIVAGRRADARKDVDPGDDAIPVHFRPTNVTETLVANGGIVSDAFLASSTARMGWGADRALTELYSKYYGTLVGLAASVVRDYPTAEEVVQDSFIEMHVGGPRLGRWPRLEYTDKALAYLRETVENRSLSVLRDRAAADKYLQKAPPDVLSAEDGALDQLERSAVVSALRDLPDLQRQAIVLRYYADLSEAEIATTMSISRGAVKRHTVCGMAALRTAMEVATDSQGW